MDISVVIPAFNEEEHIGPCLDALVNQTDTQFETIVVDNSSTDRTAEIVRTYKKKLHLKLITERQKGRGRARKTGFAGATGKYILTTDADTKVPPNWVAEMTKFFANPRVLAVTGPCRIDDRSPFWCMISDNWQYVAMTAFRIVFGHFWLSGYNYAIRREVYTNVGGINEELNALDDIDLGFKIAKIGKIAFAPHVRVIASSRRFNNGLLHGSQEIVGAFIDYLRSGKTDMRDVR